MMYSFYNGMEMWFVAFYLTFYENYTFESTVLIGSIGKLAVCGSFWRFWFSSPFSKSCSSCSFSLFSCVSTSGRKSRSRGAKNAPNQRHCAWRESFLLNSIHSWIEWIKLIAKTTHIRATKKSSLECTILYSGKFFACVELIQLLKGFRLTLVSSMPNINPWNVCKIATIKLRYSRNLLIEKE